MYGAVVQDYIVIIFLNSPFIFIIVLFYHLAINFIQVSRLMLPLLHIGSIYWHFVYSANIMIFKMADQPGVFQDFVKKM